MIRVHIFCEGQTEEVFVREVLREHFQRLGIWLNPIIIRTSALGKGGVSTYGKIRHQIEIKCKEDPTAWVTTLLDFYGLPKDSPGMKNPMQNSMAWAEAVSQAFQDDIARQNFIAHLLVHEYEGLLFSAPEAFGTWFDSPDVVNELTTIRSQFDSPEHINNSRTTAPSKRILSICDSYDKPMHGSLIASDIGLDKIRQECPLFNRWIERLEALEATPPG